MKKTYKNKKGLKERFYFYHKQKKFQLSVVDWNPHVDWYFLLLFLLIVIIYANVFAYNIYHNILFRLEQEPQGVNVKKEIVNYQVASDLVETYESKEEVLNNLR